MKICLTLVFRDGVLARLREAWRLVVRSEVRLQPQEIARLRSWLDEVEMQADVERVLGAPWP